MHEFKDARVVGNSIILNETMTRERFQKFVRSWYSGQVPVYKPVGMFIPPYVTLNGAKDNHYDDIRDYEFIMKIADYIPVNYKEVPGAYGVQGIPIDFDVSIKERALFRDRALLHGRSSKSVPTVAPFNPSVNPEDIIQVFARVRQEELGVDDDRVRYSPQVDKLVSTVYRNDKLGGLVLPERVNVAYKDFSYYGYDTWKLEHKDNPLCLVNKTEDILFKSGDGRSRLRTPIIICYRHRGTMSAGEIVNTLLREPIKEFVPFEEIRFSIAEHININVGQFEEGNEIKFIAVSDINPEALEVILRNYGEEE